MRRRLLLSAAAIAAAGTLALGAFLLTSGATESPAASTADVPSPSPTTTMRWASGELDRDSVTAAREDAEAPESDDAESDAPEQDAPSSQQPSESAKPSAPKSSDPAPAAPAAPAADFSDQSTVLALVNSARADAGLPPMTISSKLSSAAGAQAVRQASNQQMTHEGGGGLGARVSATGYRWCAVAENVAAGYTSASAVHAGWMNSPGHRANIVSSNTEMGLAKATGADGTVYWAQVFGTPC